MLLKLFLLPLALIKHLGICTGSNTMFPLNPLQYYIVNGTVIYIYIVFTQRFNYILMNLCIAFTHSYLTQCMQSLGTVLSYTNISIDVL